MVIPLYKVLPYFVIMRMRTRAIVLEGAFNRQKLAPLSPTQDASGDRFAPDGRRVV